MAPPSSLRARTCVPRESRRREEQRWFAGRSSWRLRPEGTSFRIAAKRVDLLNADQDSGHLRFTIPF
jgi:hypothetical protein